MFDLNLGLQAQCRTLERRNGLIENWWTASNCEMDWILYRIVQIPAKDGVQAKMGRNSVLQHVRSQFGAASPMLILANKEWTA
jgi:hypothetical protein